MVQEGKKPFYLKKSAQRDLVLADQFLQLQSKGRLDSFMNKKRKKLEVNSKKLLPRKKKKSNERKKERNA